MDYTKQLTKEELDEFTLQTNNLHCDEKIRQACVRYFLEYKASVPNIPSDKLSTTLRCTYFIAEKSQPTFNMKGEKVRGIGLYLNQFLKNNQLDDFIIILKEILKKIKITDADAEADLNHVIKRISFLITFHTKFEKVIQKLNLKEFIGESFGYSKIFSSFVWLIYVDAKNHILKNSLELIENTCMLAHVIAFMLICSWDYLRPAAYVDKKFADKKEINLFVQEKVLEMFLIKTIDTYRLIAGSFEDYFNGLAHSNILKFSAKTMDFLSPEHINLNYKKLDYSFQKALTPEDIDERIFFKDRAANLTPSKFTPLSRHGYVSKMATKQPAGRPTQLGGGNFDSNKENFSSHRILTYEMIEKSESQTPKGVTNINEIKFPKQVINSPSLTKPTLICSTPVTTGMEMYNYLNDKAKKAKDANYPVRKSDSSITHMIQELLEKSSDKKNDKTKQIKSNLIFSLYKITSEEYGQLYPQDRENQGLARALLALSTQLVFFVSNITMTFEEIEEMLETGRLDQWKACDFFLKFDRAMPSALKLHLLDIEVNIVSAKIWLDEQLVHHMHSFANGGNYEGPYGEVLEKCFKRLLHQIAFQITQLSQILKLDDRVSQNVFDTVKYLLVHHTDLLHYRHIDQMIICSMYANCRASQIDIKFNEIKSKYEQANPNNKPFHDQIICKVYLGDQRVDLIKFYNAMFIGQMRTFITSIKESQPIHHKVGAPILQSPLRAIIPKELSFNKIPNQAKKASKTPQTNLLYAYNESPILKYEMNAFKGTALQSRKVINFDKEEQMLKKKCNEIAEQDDGLSQTNDYISKKFRKPPTTMQHLNPPHKNLYDRR